MTCSLTSMIMHYVLFDLQLRLRHARQTVRGVSVCNSTSNHDLLSQMTTPEKTGEGAMKSSATWYRRLQVRFPVMLSLNNSTAENSTLLQIRLALIWQGLETRMCPDAVAPRIYIPYHCQAPSASLPSFYTPLLLSRERTNKLQVM
jgi:hypothetical protein